MLWITFLVSLVCTITLISSFLFHDIVLGKEYVLKKQFHTKKNLYISFITLLICIISLITGIIFK